MCSTCEGSEQYTSGSNRYYPSCHMSEPPQRKQVVFEEVQTLGWDLEPHIKNILEKNSGIQCGAESSLERTKLGADPPCVKSKTPVQFNSLGDTFQILCNKSIKRMCCLNLDHLLRSTKP